MTKKDHIPDKPHYAIVELESLRYSSGYEGSSYDCECHFTNYYYTYNEDAWKNKITELTNVKSTYDRKPFFAMKVDKLAKVTTQINVEIS